MTRKRSGLGKGLDALIPAEENKQPEGGIIRIPLKDIKPNPRQPRVSFDPEELSDLATSIRNHGILQPLILTHGDSPGNYILVAGERRWQAAKVAGILAVPAIIRDVDEKESLELALIENLQRTDLKPLEAAEAYRQLAEDFALSQETIAQRVGKNRVTITNTLRLLKLPQSVKEALSNQQITEGHARALLTLSTPQSQSAALQTIIKKGLNVRQTEDLVRKLSGQRSPQPQKRTTPPEIKALEEQLRDHLGTKISLNHRRKGGTLVIYYYSEEELESLIERLLGNGSEQS